jgi:3-hydroxyisobutyrate dehydrogenase-like beta-hydroxyacid dehydrogenase
MAANLQKHGYPLVVFNRTRAKAEPLLGPCGTFSDSPAKLAEQVDVVFTMLAHPDAVEQAALGPDGFLDHLRANALWVDCSSVNPSFSRKMAAEAARRRDFGTKIEVILGLSPSKRIVNNPPDSLVSGQVVRVSSAASPSAKK